MEVFLYNSTVCRLCGEENDSGTLLYTHEENNPSLCEIINSYLPIKVSDDGQLPRTICPGCTIQLEAMVEFLNLIINGQKVIRELHKREREYKKNLLKGSDEDVLTEKIVYEIGTEDGVYQVEHPVSLQVAGLEKPKRKRGRPPKKPKTPEFVEEAKPQIDDGKDGDEESSGKRRRKAPTRFRETVQGKELDRIFKEEGVTDGEESDNEKKKSSEGTVKSAEQKEPEVIGHLETSGELVVVVKGKGRGRPKGRMRPTREECAICGMEFSGIGRYMCHIASHGPVLYQCGECAQTFSTRLTFTDHQEKTGHSGQNVIANSGKEAQCGNPEEDPLKLDTPIDKDHLAEEPKIEPSNSMPDLGVKLEDEPTLVSDDVVLNVESSPTVDSNKENSGPKKEENPLETSLEVVGPKGKVKLKCSKCDKMFSSKQSRSLHIKAVHEGSRAYSCLECGAKFAYPRSLALHALKHRRHLASNARYACDLCGKVLNHPSSVVYHKEAEHAGQRYVCNKCGKHFKHKQLLHRHQLVHSQARPYSCKTCDATFKTKANLINHQLLHSGVKKFSCEICKHKFAHKTSLILHMRWHTGSKPYVCNVCGKCFSQKGNLSEHERIHTGEKPYECSECSRRFTTSSQYRLHARRHLPERQACQPKNEPGQKKLQWRRKIVPVFSRVVPETTLKGSGAMKRSCQNETVFSPLVPRSLNRSGRQQCTSCGRLAINRRRVEPFLCHTCTGIAPHRNNTHKQKQISLLVPDKPPVVQEESPQEVIYVTYDVEDSEPAFHILDPDQAACIEVEQSQMDVCELYCGGAVLSPELSQPQPAVQDDNIPVTDEQGNPLHFTMQDGTRLAITSVDGKTLQVVTQDGQTIPVEVNGYSEDEVTESPNTIVHQLNLQKESSVTSPVAHYFTIV